MKIRFAVLGCGLAALAVVGCVKSDSKAKVEKDGSGSLTQTLVVDLEKMKQIAEMFKGMTGGAEAPGGMGDAPKAEPDTMISLDDLKASIASVPGLKLVDAKQETPADGKSVKMNLEVAFSDLSLLTKANLMPAAELAKNADGSWTLSYDASFNSEMGGKPDGKAPEGHPAGPDAAGFDPSAMLGMFEPIVGDMSIAVTLNLPGTVVETNGTKGDDGAVSWKLGFKDLMGGKASMKVTFKGDDLALQPFKVKADPSKMMEHAGKHHPTTPDAPKPGGAVPPPEKPVEPPPTDPSK
jgi:hypothetical protein